MKFANGTSTELWRGDDAQVVGAPAISTTDDTSHSRSDNTAHQLLYRMQADGTNVRVVADSLDLQAIRHGLPMVSRLLQGVVDHGIPQLCPECLSTVHPTPVVKEYSVDPAWFPDGRFMVFSGPDIGTTFSVKTVTADGATSNPSCSDSDARTSPPGLPA